MDPQSQIQRYNDSERINHWIVAIAFILAALSGLSMFHPALFWLSNLFGGGPWTRILHPFIGVVMFAAFLSMMLRFWGYNRIDGRDRQWLKQWRDVVNNREDRLPDVGRYNAGQKALFWLTVICVITLFVTGVLFWRPWFAEFFPVTLVRLATLLHSGRSISLAKISQLVPSAIRMGRPSDDSVAVAVAKRFPCLTTVLLTWTGPGFPGER